MSAPPFAASPSSHTNHNNKSSTAQSITTTDVNVEGESSGSGSGSGVGKDSSTRTMKATSGGGDEEPTFHNLAQMGNLDAINSLYTKRKEEDKPLDLNERDEGGVTALHWAAINNHVGVCEWLIDNGADIDPIGGDLLATPLQWAARNGHLPIIHLLLSRSADPSIRDGQGYNTLHLVTHSSGVMALLYLLRRGVVGVDERDGEGHTALMWAAWQGDALSIDILLRHSASLTSTDNTLLTPLHWAAVKGSRPCIARLLKAGADMGAKDENGKTPGEMARELKAEGPWKGGLEDAGVEEGGGKVGVGRLDEVLTQRLILVLPTCFFGLMFYVFAESPIYTGIPLVFAIFFGMHHIITSTLLRARKYGDEVAGSPYFAAIIAASIVWVGTTWVCILLRGTPGYLFTNALFIISTLICAISFSLSIRTDPGWTNNNVGEEQLNEIVEDLTARGMFNGTYFCISCMAKKPLRAKHCRICNRCTGRFDHHCPWIWNCVGFNNHPFFLTFVGSLVVGIVSFDVLAVAFFSSHGPPYDNTYKSTYITFCGSAPSICNAYSESPFLLGVMIWASIQLTWTIILLGSQIWQVCRQMTTLEVSNLGRYGFMGGRGGSSLREQAGALGRMTGEWATNNQIRAPERDIVAVGAGVGQSGADEEGLVTMNGDATGDSPTPVTASSAQARLGGQQHDHGHSHHNHNHRCGVVGHVCSGVLRYCTQGPMLQLLGLDRFTKGQAGRGLKMAADSGGNPFSMGVVANCEDFWTRGGALGVDYRALYEIPQDGFQRRSTSAYRRLRMLIPGRNARGGDYELVSNNDSNV